MFLSEEEIEIQILLKKYNLAEDKGFSLALILQHYFMDDYDFTGSMNELRKITNLPEAQAKEIILSGCLLYLAKVEPEKKEELKKVLEGNKVDYEKVKAELEEIRLSILTPRDLSYVDINEKDEALGLFKNNVKDILASEFDESIIW